MKHFRVIYISLDVIKWPLWGAEILQTKFSVSKCNNHEPICQNIYNEEINIILFGDLSYIQALLPIKMSLGYQDVSARQGTCH